MWDTKQRVKVYVQKQRSLVSDKSTWTVTVLGSKSPSALTLQIVTDYSTMADTIPGTVVTVRNKRLKILFPIVL